MTLTHPQSLALLALCVAALSTPGSNAQTAGAPNAPQPSTTGLELANPYALMLTVKAGAHATKHGLTMEALRARIEPRFGSVGIKTSNPNPEGGRLEVQVESDSTGMFFSLSINFHRAATFTTGTKTFRGDAITWNRWIQGTFEQNPDVVLYTAQRLIDEFLMDLKAANPNATLRGKVSAVDPKYKFVVLNFGKNKGVKENAELDVMREGRLIAVVRVVTVEDELSYANILPEPKPDGDVLEGDDVVPRR